MRHAIMTAAALLVAVTGGFGSGVSEGASFTSFGIDLVTVNAQFLDVDVGAAEGLAVSLASHGQEGSLFTTGDYRILHEQVGSTLKVWVETERLFFGGFDDGSISLRVPGGTRVEVETASGRIAVDGTECRSLAVKSVSGTVRLRGVRGNIDASSVSGALSLEDAAGAIRAKTVSGAIEGRDVSFTDDSSFSSVSGTIDILCKDDPDSLRFDLSSVSGKIVVDGVRAKKGLRMGFGTIRIRGDTVSGSLTFR